MATLDNIRKRSGLVITLIGVALGAFVLTDALGSGATLNSANQSIVGEINGQTIDNTDFSSRMEEIRKVDQAYSNLASSALANIVWQNWAREVVMGEMYDELGFKVTGAELSQEVINNPNIRQMPAFQNQNGMFDPMLMSQMLDNLEAQASQNEQALEQWNGWVRFEQDVKEQALTFKFNDAVELGVYTPKALARHNYMYGNVSHDIAFVQYPYADIADDEVEVTEADFKSYYEENKFKYSQPTESRDIIFVNFPLEPAQRDKDAARNELISLINKKGVYNNQTGKTDSIPGFADTKDDSTFVMLNSSLPYRSGFWREGQLGNMDSIMFNAEPGFIYGPYEEAGAYKVTKLQEVRMLPDSVEARHILIGIQSERNPEGHPPAEAKSIADSLFAYVKENRGEFATVAKEMSEDPGSGAEGGDLGFFGPNQMVPSFGNYCFQNEVGDLGLVSSQFGYHIIEIQDQKGSSKAVRVATLTRDVVMSNETEKEIYNRAAEFAAAVGTGDFAAVAEERGYVARPMTELKENADNIPGLGQARPVVKWAYGAMINQTTGESGVEVGDIELINNDNTAYVVVQLTDVAPKGTKSLERVREQIRPMVINRAKADLIMERAKADMEGKENIQAIANASEYNMSIQQIRLGNGAITGAGQEPTVVGQMSASQTGTIYGPVAGNQGVYIWQQNAATEFQDKGDYNNEANAQTSSIKSRVNAQLLNALLKEAEMEDNRIRFY